MYDSINRFCIKYLYRKKMFVIGLNPCHGAVLILTCGLLSVKLSNTLGF